MAEDEYQPPTIPPTTYVPQIDVATRFNLPQKIAVLLHPRRAHVADPFASKMGGQFAWPKSEPWPICVDHGDIYVPILQLRKGDVPELGFPDGTDLFQLIWCPDDHEETFYGPQTQSFWRLASAVDDVLGRTNPPFNFAIAKCVPKECKLYPERVEETQPDLEDEIVEEVGAFVAQNAQEDFDAMNVLAQDRDESAYAAMFSAAPSTKVGGYCAWIQDGEVPFCECEEEMEHLLTVASGDVGDAGSFYRWAPSDITRNETGFVFQSHQGSGLCVGDVGSIYVFICRNCEGFPTTCQFQCC